MEGGGSRRPGTGSLILWAFLAPGILGLAALIFAGIGKLLSEAPRVPEAVDALRGLAGPVEMNRHIDGMLTMGKNVLTHDAGRAGTIGLMLAATCLLPLGAAIAYIIETRRLGRAIPHASRAKWLIFGLALIPVAGAVVMKARQPQAFQSVRVVKAFANRNTEPEVVVAGKRVTIRMPVAMQSFFGYYEVVDFSLKEATATIVDGSKIEVTLLDPIMPNGDRRPGKTDLIPLMESTVLHADVTVPSDRALEGAVVDVWASGTVRIMSGDRRMFPQPFATTTQFRIARDSEVEYAKAVEEIGKRLRAYIYMGLVVGAASLVGAWVVTPSERKT